METKHKHLEFVQAVINRMAQNSFLIKGWTITIIAALFAFANKSDEMDSRYLLIALIPVVFFWFLDAYFLRQERLFRALYNDIRKKSGEQIDFSMDTSPFKEKVSSIVRICFSSTIIMYYVPILVVIILAMFFLPKL